MSGGFPNRFERCSDAVARRFNRGRRRTRRPPLRRRCQARPWLRTPANRTASPPQRAGAADLAPVAPPGLPPSPLSRSRDPPVGTPVSQSVRVRGRTCRDRAAGGAPLLRGMVSRLWRGQAWTGRRSNSPRAHRAKHIVPVIPDPVGMESLDPAHPRERPERQRLRLLAAAIVIEEQDELLDLRRIATVRKRSAPSVAQHRDTEQDRGGQRRLDSFGKPKRGPVPPSRTAPLPNRPSPHRGLPMAASPRPCGWIKVRWIATSPCSSRTAAIMAGRSSVNGLGPCRVRG